LLLFAACWCGFAQAPAKVEFEVVSIKPSPPVEPNKGFSVGCNGGPETKDPALFRCQNMDLSNLLTRAYSIMRFQLTGPDWLREQRFDITAKLPEGATKDDLNLMIQNMLVERFKLTVHHESKEMPKFDLVVAKSGSKLKESVDAPPPSGNATSGPGRLELDKDGFPVLAAGRPGMAMMNGRARMFYPKWTTEQLARQLAGQLGKPVTDATGLQGKYDIAIYWAEGTVRAAGPPPSAPGGGASAMAAVPEGESGPTLQQAIQEQLGLRLQATRGPVDFIVVDHLEKLPTDN
jgi:uncharacterized protein (TIGR03435 family)